MGLVARERTSTGVAAATRERPARPAPGGVASATTPARQDRARTFRVATGAAAAVLLLDAFVLVEPGASRVSHLGAGTGGVLLLALAGATQPRLRSGWRAVVAASIGALALVRFAVAVVDLADGSPTGDDWAALLLLPAGAALLAVASAEAWGSRRPGRWRWPRRLARTLVLALVGYWLILPLGVAVVATERPRSTPAGALGLPHERVTLETADGLRLAAWYVPSSNGAAVLVLPGREGTLRHARLLAAHGYGVLLVDLRGQGESEGDPNAFGWGSSLDVDAAVAYLAARPDVEPGRIGGLGLSVGGEVLLEAAASNDGVRAVVSEGAGERSVRETALLGPRGWPTLPGAAVQTVAVAILAGRLPPPALDDAAAAIGSRPLLLVYGARGQGAERELNPIYLRAATGPAQLWEVPDATHTGGLEARPAEYERRVVGFLDDALRR